MARIIKNIEQARRVAQSRWGSTGDAWIVGGTRFVSRNRLMGNPAQGWNHFDGQGNTWDAAFIDAAFKLRIEEMVTAESTERQNEVAADNRNRLSK